MPNLAFVPAARPARQRPGLHPLSLIGSAVQRYRAHRRARFTRETLHALDDAILRDIGLRRDDIDSVVHEMAARS